MLDQFPAACGGTVVALGEDIGALMPGTVDGAGPGSRLGAAGSWTGSRIGFSLCRIELHPATKTNVAASAVRWTMAFINRLLRECMGGENPFIEADIIIPHWFLGSRT